MLLYTWVLRVGPIWLEIVFFCRLMRVPGIIPYFRSIYFHNFFTHTSLRIATVPVTVYKWDKWRAHAFALPGTLLALLMIPAVGLLAWSTTYYALKSVKGDAGNTSFLVIFPNFVLYIRLLLLAM